MNLAAAVAIALSAASTATVSAYSFSSKGSKYSSKASAKKSKAAKSAKSGSYSMSISLPSCKSQNGLQYDTGSEFLDVDVEALVTPEPGLTFEYFSFSGPPNPDDGECYAGDELGVMRFTADNDLAPDGTMSECTYQACYEEGCAPSCCCSNIILIEVTD